MLKSIYRLSIVLLALFTCAACEKGYTCACTFTYQVGGQTISDDALSVEEFRSKSQAKEFCDDREEDYLTTGASAANCVSSVN